jgi:malonyl-CoA decarboxylase
LSNGARLERINTYADDSEERHATSFGCMVNYLYEPDEVEANHEAFVTRGEIAMSKALGKQYKKILAIPGLKPANA